MVEKSINRLHDLVERTPNLLMLITEERMSYKSSPTKWSKREILGHLIDSATNNHQRLIRAQFESKPAIKYDQNKWNEYNFYQEIESEQLINFWTIYNKQLIEIIRRIPTEKLANQVIIGDNIRTLGFIIEDYVTHLEHHLSQIIEY
uniref:DinB family protein n=1 Tax=Flavobacterium sp. TaxID=239 RepID=UPI00404B228D